MKVLRLICLMVYLIIFVLVTTELLVRGYWEIVFGAYLFQIPIIALISGEDL